MLALLLFESLITDTPLAGKARRRTLGVSLRVFGNFAQVIFLYLATRVRGKSSTITSVPADCLWLEPISKLLLGVDRL
jgi:hypothetical protein